MQHIGAYESAADYEYKESQPPVGDNILLVGMKEQQEAEKESSAGDETEQEKTHG